MNRKYKQELRKAVKLVSEHTLVEPKQILSKDRHHDVAMSRHIVTTLVYRKYKPVGLSLKKLGALINRDHSTVIHSNRAVQNEIDTNPEFKRIFEQISEEYNAERLPVTAG